MTKKTIILFSACSLTIISNIFGMENNSNQNMTIDGQEKIQVPQHDLMTLLTENNKLLHTIKRQNKAILKQNYLNFEHQRLLTERCCSTTMISGSAFKKALEKEIKLQAKIKETYFTERYALDSSSSSSEDLILK